MARGVTGRKEAGDAVVERLARDYAKFLREYPDLGRNATTGRVERRARKLQRNCVGRIDRLIRETPELVGKLSKGNLVRTLMYSDEP